MSVRGVRRLVGAAGGVLLLCGGLGACAGGPPTIAPSGVDGLTIPTPSPRASDFVRTVDNPWFPLARGSRWSYRVTGGGAGAGAGDRAGGGAAGGGRRTLLVAAPGRTRVVDGVTCTGLHQVERDRRGRVVQDTWSWYAQDRAGNVWQLGGPADRGQGAWLAGTAGAQAGLVMAAHPRLGDGYVRAHAPDVAEDQATVLSVDEQRAVPSGYYTHLVETEDTSPLLPGVVVDTYYARGLGVVYRQSVSGGSGAQVLVSFARR